MIRRRFLAGTGVALSSTLAGCLGGPDGTGTNTDETTDGNADNGETDTDDIDPDFDRCDDRFIPYTMLPEEAQDEAEQAFEDGVYETDGDLWFTHAVATTSVIEKDGDYYAWEVDRNETVSRLRFEETTPTWPGTNDLELVNETDESVVVSVVGRDEDGETVFEEDDVEAKPDDDIDVTDRPDLAVSNEYTTFEVTATVDGDRREPATWAVTRNSGTQARLHITDDGTDVETDAIALHTCQQEYHD